MSSAVAEIERVRRPNCAVPSRDCALTIWHAHITIKVLYSQEDRATRRSDPSACEVSRVMGDVGFAGTAFSSLGNQSDKPRVRAEPDEPQAPLALFVDAEK